MNPVKLVIEMAAIWLVVTLLKLLVVAIHTMHYLIQYSKCDFTILESSETCMEVEALQLLLMVMLGSHESSKIPELS